MIAVIAILIIGFWLVGQMKDDDSVFRDRYNFVSRFIQAYEKDTGIRLTYDQALALIQVTVALMEKNQGDKVSPDNHYHNAQRVVDQLCAEAEDKVFRKHQGGI
jgi:hypothetical protein